MRSPFSILVVVVTILGLGVLATHRPGGSGASAPLAAEAPTGVIAGPAATQAAPAAKPVAAGAVMPTMAPMPMPATMAEAAPKPAPAAAKPPAPPPAATASGTGDSAAGRLVFRKCQACHSLEPGRNLVGPSLAGVIGRKAGTETGFAYSEAMKNANIVWTAENLGTYLTEPQKMVPGNRMPFPGLKSDHDRVDVIAFLAASPQGAGGEAGVAIAAPPAPQAPPPVSHNMPDMPDVTYTVRTGIAEGRMVYLGVGGAIDGQVNPVLSAAEGQTVQITLINGEGAEHDINFPDQDARSPRVTGKGASTTIAFHAMKAGDYIYFCSTPGHRQAGMEGKFLVTPKPAPQTLAFADISRDPADLPPPITRRTPQTVRVDLTAVEVEGRLAEGTTFGFWTFNGKVPGPFLRVRVGDKVEVHLKNAAGSSMVHSVDFHAATGPGGGAAALQVDPGGEKSMTFKALVPGLYVYHCATPMVAEHIANGMYGMILVEPENGLAPADREFYIMQGEIYTDAAYGQRGSQEFSVEKLLAEHPEYFVFNGSVGALTSLHPMHANVGDTVRLYFGVGGPNFTSSFHVIGEIFDKAYDFGSLETPPQRGIQTITVPPGGAAIAEFKAEVPGNYSVVDHALARVERGLAGTIIVAGPPNPDIYDAKPAPAAKE